MKKERRIFSAEFKQEAVALVVEQGNSCAAAGRSLGVRGNLISRWKRLLKDDASDTPEPIANDCISMHPV